MKYEKKDIQLKATAQQELYAAMVNSDRTEGKGVEYALAITKLLSTAIRLGKGQGVMGTNARIQKVTAYYIKEDENVFGQWYTPSVRIVQPSKEDETEEKRLMAQEAKDILLEKFKEGKELTKEEREEIAALLEKAK